MAGEPHQFDEAFARLTATISRQANGNGIIYLDENIRKPFESTSAPTSIRALQDLARLFEGDDSHSLFLRLDGSVVYLLVAIVLQFPPCSLLTKTIYFFMDMLSLYTDGKDVQHVLQAHLSDSLLEKELRKRQAYIFSQLIPRLKALLFEDDKHHKVKRLIAQLITRLCQGNARGWQELMNARETRLFGTLLNQVDDYVLRVLIADIIRHLLANNYDFHELWNHTSEEVMDFPTSQELHTKTISKILESMSALDARQAFNGTRESRLYRVADVNIPDMQYHSARSDTILVVEDTLILLMPDRNSDSTSFAIYEIFITQEIFLEKLQTSTKQTSHLQIRWRNAQGHVVLQGKKERVKNIRLQFAQHNSRDDFCEAFDAAFERRAQESWLAPSQEATGVALRPQRIVVNTINISDTELEVERSLHTQRKRGAENLIEDTSRPTGGMSKEFSSEPIIEQVAVTSDVFARFSDEERSPNKPTTLSKKLRLGSLERSSPASPEMLLSSHDDHGGENEASSPLKTFKRRKDVEEAAMQSHESITTNLALTMPLHQHNDADHTSLLVTASRTNTLTNKESPAGRGHAETLYRDPGLRKKKGTLTPARMKSNTTDTVRPTAETLASTGKAGVHEAAAAPRKKSHNVLTLVKSKPVRPSVGISRPIEPFVDQEHPFTQTQSLVRKKKAEMSETNQNTSGGVDWDEDLRADEHKHKRQRTENKGTVKATAKKPLRDVTNTTQDIPASSRPVGQSKTSGKSRATAKKGSTPLATPVAPARRSRRTTVKQAISYAEPSTSEDGHTPQDGSEGEDDQGAGLNKPSSHAEIETHKNRQQRTTEAKPPSTQPLAELLSRRETTTKASRHDSTTRPLVEVSSSDHEDEIDGSLSGDVSLRPGDRQPNEDSAMRADTQVEEDDEVLEDSYPRLNSEPQILSTAADRSFGTKLSNMIATTPAAAGRTLGTSNAPFGNRKQFVHNVNAAKRTESLSGKFTVPSATLSTAATPTVPSEMFDAAGAAEHQQGLENFASVIDTSTLDQILPAAMSVKTSLDKPLGPHHDVGLQADDTRVPMPINVKMPEIVRKTLGTHNDMVSNHTRSFSTGKTAGANEQPPQMLTDKLEQLSNPPQVECGVHAITSESRRNTEPEATNGSSTPISSGIVVDFQPSSKALTHRIPESYHVTSSTVLATSNKGPSTAQTLSLLDEQQHHQTRSIKSHASHGSPTPDHTSVEHGKLLKTDSVADQIFTAASSKTMIIHVASVGPQNQGSPSKAKTSNKPKICEQPAVNNYPPSLSPGHNHKRLQSQHIPDQAKVSNANRPVSKSRPREMNELPHARLTSKEQRSDSFDGDCSNNLMDDTFNDDKLQDSAVTSLATEPVNEADPFSRRSDRVSQPRQILPVVSYAQIVTSENNASTEPEYTSQSLRPESFGSSLEMPVCISSAHMTSEADQDEESLHEVPAEYDTRKVKPASRDYKHRAVEKPAKASTDHGTVPFICKKLEQEQTAVTTDIARTGLPEKMSSSIDKRLLPIKNTTLCATVASKDDSRLFSLNTTARRIFSKKDTSKLLKNTTFTGKPGENEPARGITSVNKVGMKLRSEGIGMGKHNRPSTPSLPPPLEIVQGLTHGAREDQTDPIASGSKKATGNYQVETTNQISNDLNIVRVKRGQPSPDRSFGTVLSKAALPVSTPQAFVRQLHAPTSPPSASKELCDKERARASVPNDSDFAQTTLVNHPHSSRGVKLLTSVQPSVYEASSTMMSSESRANRPMIVQGEQQYSSRVQSVSVFGSTIQQTVFDITQEITARVDAEERLAMTQVEEYRIGSLEVAKDLRCSSVSRLDYDATKLATVLTGQRQLVADAKLYLSEKSSLAARSERLSDYVEQHTLTILTMLDNVQH